MKREDWRQGAESQLGSVTQGREAAGSDHSSKSGEIQVTFLKPSQAPLS